MGSQRPILTWHRHRFLPTSDHADTPWGAMPFLEMEETTRIGGSHVILQFLGERFSRCFSTAGHDASGHVVWVLCTSSFSFASPLQVWLGLMMWRMHRLQQQSMLSLTLWRKFPRSCSKKMRRERYSMCLSSPQPPPPTHPRVCVCVCTSAWWYQHF